MTPPCARLSSETAGKNKKQATLHYSSQGTPIQTAVLIVLIVLRIILKYTCNTAALISYLQLILLYLYQRSIAYELLSERQVWLPDSLIHKESPSTGLLKPHDRTLMLLRALQRAGIALSRYPCSKAAAERGRPPGVGIDCFELFLLEL